MTALIKIAFGLIIAALIKLMLVILLAKWWQSRNRHSTAKPTIQYKALTQLANNG